MPDYTISRAGWLADTHGVGAHRQIGETVTLTEREAAYLVRSGQIQVASAPAVDAGSRRAPKAKTGEA